MAEDEGDELFVSSAVRAETALDGLQVMVGGGSTNHRISAGADDQVAHAVGGRGPNRAYLEATAAHLAQLGIADADLDALVIMVQRITA